MRMDLFKEVDFRFPSTRVVFGVNAALDLNKLIKDYSPKKILSITDKGIIKGGD